MHSSVNYEDDELVEVPSAYSRSCPWAVVVMHFYTTVAFSSVEAPGRLNDVTGGAELQRDHVSTCLRRVNEIFVV